MDRRTGAPSTEDAAFVATLERAQEGDHDALSGMLEGAMPALRGSLVIAPAWRTHVEVDDVLQVTCIEAFLRVSSVRARTSGEFVAWLRAAAKNNLRDAIRSLGCAKRPPAQRKLVDTGESASVLFDALFATSHTASRSVAGREAVDYLQRAIERLPKTYQRVVQAIDLDGRKVVDVASDLGRSEGAVYMLRARAHDRLRELLGSSTHFF